MQNKLTGNITTNINAPRGTGHTKNLDPAKFIANVKYTTVIPNKRAQKTLQIENLNGKLPVKDVINFPTTSGFSRPNSEPLRSNLPHELKRSMPQHELNTSKMRNIYIRKEVDNEYNFKRNLPLTSAGTSKGLNYDGIVSLV